MIALSSVAANYYKLASKVSLPEIMYEIAKTFWLEILTLIETNKLTEDFKDKMFSLSRNLGCVAIKLNDTKTARDYFNMALDHVETDAQREDIEKRLQQIPVTDEPDGP